MAPDWGYVPGVGRFFSELAHYVDTADLTRSLLAAARTTHERAFAWGWVTHVLGDIAIHPLVGRAYGEHLYGDRELRLNSSADVTTHVAIEIGLDIVFLGRAPSISPPPSNPYLHHENVGQLLTGLRQTYGLTWDPARLIGLHRRAARLTAAWRPALAIVANRAGMRNGDWRRLQHAGARGGWGWVDGTTWDNRSERETIEQGGLGDGNRPKSVPIRPTTCLNAARSNWRKWLT